MLRVLLIICQKKAKIVIKGTHNIMYMYQEPIITILKRVEQLVKKHVHTMMVFPGKSALT